MSADFFDGPSSSNVGSIKAATKVADERWDLTATARFDMAPDEDEDAIEVAPMTDSAAPEEGGSEVSAFSVGHLLLKGMASNAKRVNPECLKAVVASMPHVPSTVGGFVGAGGTTHSAIDIDVGMIVCLMNPPPASSIAGGSIAGVRTSSVTFKKDKDITDEERLFGSAITEATVATIGQVMKKDTSLDEDMTIGLADGSKTITRRSELRLATQKEVELFRKWLSDASTLPTEALRLKRQRSDNATVASILGGQQLASGVIAPQRRWLQKRLHVRYVGDARRDLMGKKFMVSSVNYKDDRVLVEELVVAANGGGLVAGSGGIETVATKDLETVLPKAGGRGLVLDGPHKGQMATLVRRVKKSDGDGAVLIRVAATTSCTSPSDDMEEIEVSPDDFCAM